MNTITSKTNIIPTTTVINCPITALTFNEQIAVIMRWAGERISRSICVANVHMVMESYWDKSFNSVLSSADLITPDGMPLVWMMRMMGIRSQNRVAGMDILLTVCQLASLQNIGVFFLGSQPQILNQIKARLEQEFPNLYIAGMESLPFYSLDQIDCMFTEIENNGLIQRINESGAGLVLISLGCPKQEIFMARYKEKIQAVMIGLGGAFPVYAGVHRWAPRWVRDLGLEWLYRFLQEPRRLWKRYFITIPPFMWLSFQQLLQYQGLLRHMGKVTEET